MYTAHTSGDGRLQTVEEHLCGTACLAKDFAKPLGAEELAFFTGRLHDAGKYSDEFQKHIMENASKTDHSTAGAKAALKAVPNGTGLVAAYCIAGHHAGLPDGGHSGDTDCGPTLCARLKREVPDFSKFYAFNDPAALIPTSVPDIHMIGKCGFTSSFFIRMLFSCLVDADFLDTEKFMSGGTVERGGAESISALWRKFQKYTGNFANPVSEINKKRTEILNQCLNKASGKKGLYTLTVPTGGGKTISSLAFALRHAAEHGMEHIIYAIPYTSIIEQNADVFREILGTENVLEHHSSFVFSDSKDDKTTKAQERLKLAAENWDVPVVVTTNVQFFESLFANRPSKCRKLHNIADSVIIFDEAQMIPREYLMPCIRAITELIVNYGCTAVLCSATQPALSGFFIPEVKSSEICENTKGLYQFFRRTTFVNCGEVGDSELEQKLNREKQVLCIVNTKKHARNLYYVLKNSGTYHLSTLMTPSHRKQKLDEIRGRLKAGEDCRVVSTSLIEAGVDVDFPSVYREEAGLDSEIQAAGRCNREGKRSAAESMVYIFRPEEKYRGRLPYSLQLPCDAGKTASKKFTDIASPEAIKYYFETMYNVSGNSLDTKGIVDMFEEGADDNFSFPFASAAEKFHFIESGTRPILIPKEDAAKALLQRPRGGEKGRGIFRAAGPYCVSTYENHFKKLYDSGKIEILECGIAVLSDISLYSDETGLAFDAGSGEAFFV